MRFIDVNRKLREIMYDCGLDSSRREDWEEYMDMDMLDDLLESMFDLDTPASFLSLIVSYAVIKARDLDNTLPDVVEFDEAPQDELIKHLVAMQKLHKLIGDSGRYSNVLASNRALAAEKLGQLLDDSGVSKLEYNEAGVKVANIKLEVKDRPNWTEREHLFEFLRGIGQEDVIQPSAPWQTVEKIVNLSRDELPMASYDGKTGTFNMDTVPDYDETTRANNFFAYDNGESVCFAERRGEEDIVTLCSLYTTRNAKVTKLYE